ncbi:MAG: hypothetical protein NZ473_08670, partial [Candidatus Kapabacteria bacterium]|nr:hypothetical protein [Candidatus Kapabacteria bacterium]MDW8226126.1 hypothetical protein [Bacteroidota bacterium]
METVPLAVLSERFDEQLWKHVGPQVEAGRDSTVSAAAGSVAPLLVATLWRRLQRPVLVISPSAEEVQEWHYDLQQLCEGASVVPWSRQPRQLWEQLRHIDGMQAQGVETAWAVSRRRNVILLCSPEVFAVSLPAPAELQQQGLCLYVGMEYVPEELQQQLLRHGFQRVEAVSAPGDIARRGAIMDIFPVGWDEPLRVEFWGNTVESLRCFDPETQRSTARFERVEFLCGVLWDHAYSRLWDFLPPETLVVIESPERVRQAWVQTGDTLSWEMLSRWQRLILNPLGGGGTSLGSASQPPVGRSVVRLVEELRCLMERGYEL